MKTLILGMGNTLLSDDGIGVVIKRYLEKILSHCIYVTFCETSWGGFKIIDLLAGFDYAVIIDSIKTGNKPQGFIHHYKPTDFLPTLRLTSYHDINFITALKLAELMDSKIPADIDIFAVEINDNRSINEFINPSLWKSIKLCSKHIADILFEKNIIHKKVSENKFSKINSANELNKYYADDHEIFVYNN